MTSLRLLSPSESVRSHKVLHSIGADNTWRAQLAFNKGRFSVEVTLGNLIDEPLYSYFVKLMVLDWMANQWHLLLQVAWIWVGDFHELAHHPRYTYVLPIGMHLCSLELSWDTHRPPIYPLGYAPTYQQTKITNFILLLCPTALLYRHSIPTLPTDIPIPSASSGTSCHEPVFPLRASRPGNTSPIAVYRTSWSTSRGTRDKRGRLRTPWTH